MGSKCLSNCLVCKLATVTRIGAQLTEQVFQKLTQYLTVANQMPMGSKCSNNCLVCKLAIVTRIGTQLTEQVFQKLMQYLTAANQTNNRFDCLIKCKSATMTKNGA
jgi:hypothetical protein